MITNRIDELLRKLAKSGKYQTIYNKASELNLRLFRNEVDFTYYQILFIDFLSMYSSIYLDVAMGDVDEIVLDNDTFEDAYLYYKNRKRRESENKLIKEKDKSKPSREWIFKSK